MAFPDDYNAGDELPAADMNKIREGSYVEPDAGETINGATLPVAIYVDDTDDEVKACDGNDQTKLEFMGFAISNSTDGNPITIQSEGIVSGFTGLDIGKKYYVQDDKTIGATVGTYEVLVGIAISATQILILHGNMEYMGSESDTADVFTPPAGARFAIINFGTNYTSAIGNIAGEWFLSKVGKTSGSVQGIVAGEDQGFVHRRITASVSWSGASITMTVTTNSGSVTISGTAYYYR